MKIGEPNKMRNKRLKHGVILSIFITFMLCMPSITLNVIAADIIVDDDGTGDYTTISAAILASSNGDTIWVKDGSYNEQLLVDKSVTIIADNGVRPTIYVSTYSPGIDVTASGVTIDGFKIYGNSNSGGGPSIRASSGSNGLKVRNNQFVVIPGEMGNTVLLITSGVQNVEFSANTLIAHDIGVLLQSGSTATITNDNLYQTYNYSVFHAARILGENRYFGTIQDAIDDAEVGDTINVADGTYTNQIIVDKTITLSNYDLGKPVIDLGSVATYAIELQQGCNGTIINGLEIINSNGIYVNLNAGGEGNVTIQNNYLHDLFVGAAAAGGFFVDAAVWPPLENWAIQDNTIENITGSLSSGMRPENMKNLIVSGNTISNMGYSGILLINIDGAVVSNNVVTNVDRAGIQVDSYCTRAIDINDNIITQANTGSHSGYGAIRFYGQQTPDPHGDPPAEITLAGNTCNDSYNGLAVRDGENISGRNITAHHTSFINNSNMGVYHSGAGILDAIDNWWGDISGPYHPINNSGGIGDDVSDNVTFWPWLEFDGYSVIPDATYVVGYPKSNEDGDVVSDITEITITASDGQSGMHSLTYRIWDTVNRWSEWKNYTENIKLTGEGKHMVQYNATDNAGTSAGTNPWEIKTHYVDTRSPDVEVLYPNGDEFINGLLQIQWTAADKILDQEQTQHNGSVPLSEDYPGHIQSFVPTEDTMGSVQLLIDGDDANVSVKVFSQITPVPLPIAQSTQRLQAVGNPGSPVWMDFPFDSNIDLDVGKTYYIGVTQENYGNTGFNWYYLNSSGGEDPYKYGHVWVKETDALVNMSEWDWGFRTMLWETDIGIDVEYSMTGVSPWSTIAEYEVNDGYYAWDTTPFPDGELYRVRIVAQDEIVNLGADISDNKFSIDNDGPSVSNVVITDTTIENTEFTKNGDNLEITATIAGDPINISADLSGFGKGTAELPTSYIGGTAKWIVHSIICSPSEGPISVVISATDSTGDSSSNSGSTIADNTAPILDITRPGPGLYFMDSMRLVPFAYPFIIGQITVIADATDGDGSGIEKVEFYLENKLEASVIEAPYSWLWDRAATGFFDIEVIAYDNAGHSTTDEIRDLFIINLDIWNPRP